MVDTFEKMDAINPTFDLEGKKFTYGLAGLRSNEDKIHVFSNFNHLFGLVPFVQ
jgi:hypothetical protein